MLIGLVGLLIGCVIGCGIGFVAGHFGGHGRFGDGRGHSRFDDRRPGNFPPPGIRGPRKGVPPAGPTAPNPVPTKS
ncbi:MAG: hypothetical protein AUI14_22330 [Actinobacteria bacterium 13_2_20CM_2_71_6]|nr:MAG: hypothetical protein AUI14_22330 [Actinobacteria bacterium 13_2_20CM_2_71_6]